jgi:hypothetical protein
VIIIIFLEIYNDKLIHCLSDMAVHVIGSPTASVIIRNVSGDY